MKSRSDATRKFLSCTFCVAVRSANVRFRVLLRLGLRLGVAQRTFAERTAT